MSGNKDDGAEAILGLVIVCAMILAAIVIVLGPWIAVFSESGWAARALLIVGTVFLASFALAWMVLTQPKPTVSATGRGERGLIIGLWYLLPAWTAVFEFVAIGWSLKVPMIIVTLMLITVALTWMGSKLQRKESEGTTALISPAGASTAVVSGCLLLCWVWALALVDSPVRIPAVIGTLMLMTNIVRLQIRAYKKQRVKDMVKPSHLRRLSATSADHYYDWDVQQVVGPTDWHWGEQSYNGIGDWVNWDGTERRYEGQHNAPHSAEDGLLLVDKVAQDRRGYWQQKDPWDESSP